MIKDGGYSVGGSYDYYRSKGWGRVASRWMTIHFYGQLLIAGVVGLILGGISSCFIL